MKLLFLSILLISLSFDSDAKQKYYKWVDKDGNIHYSKTKPEKNKSSEISVSSVRSKPVSYDNDEESEDETENTEKTPEQLAAEQRNKELLAQNEQIKMAQDKANCSSARKNLTTIQNTVRVRRQNPDTGEYYRMGDDERAKMLAQARNNIKKFCK